MGVTFEIPEKARVKQVDYANSQHVGVIGERKDFVLRCIGISTAETDFGLTTIYRFVDANDNVFVCFSTKNLGRWGDGGLIATQDHAFAAKLRSQRLHGGTREY